MNIRLAITIILTAFTAHQKLSAQESLPIRNFTNIDYQAQQQNWAVSQNEEGLIYAGNSDGLLEYDGAMWHLYPFDNGQPVRAVLCDGDRIYVGGYGEFGYWHKNTENKLQYHSLSSNSGITSTESEEIWHIIKTRQGIFFQSFSRIYELVPETGEKPARLTEIKGPQNFMFVFKANQKLLLQLIGGELYDLSRETFRPVPGTKSLANTSVSAILPYTDGQLMVVTAKHGIYLWKSGVLTEWNPKSLSVFKKDIVNKALILQNGHFAFGTLLSGVYIVSPEGAIIAHFNKQNGLQNNSVLGLYQDRQKNLWVALDKGIDLVPLSSPVSQYRSEDMPLEATYSVALWRKRLYVGTNRGVFWKPWPSDESFKEVRGLEGHVWELKNHNDQLICGHSEGTFLITEKGHERLSSIPGGWTTHAVKTGNEEILLQGTYTGLSVYRQQADKKWVFTNTIENVPPIPIKHIGQTSNGTLWLAHAHKGLYKATLDSSARSARNWEQVTTPAALKDAYNVDITSWKGKPIVHSGNLFYQSDYNDRLLPGLILEENPTIPINIREGINGDWFRIYPTHIVLESSNGNTTNIPVSLIRNNETIIPIDDRYYFFCTHNGYFVYDRNYPETNDNTIKPILRSISDQHDKTIFFPLGEKITIPARSRAIAIGFFMPVYGESVRFRYTAEELSPGWSEWSDQRLINLNNLKPGQYSFQLQNSYNNQLLTFKIEVLPYWYESGWTRMVILLLALAALLGLYYWQERRMHEQRRKLTLEHEDKLRQRELSNQKRIVELQNEKLASEINLKSQQLSNIAINVIRKNEILESIKTELVEVKQELGQQLPNLHYQKLLDSVNRNLSGKDDWTLFEDNFTDVHEEFFKRIKRRHPDISPSELRLAAALRMNLSSKEIAPILGISIRGVEIKRYRLRKKLGLEEDTNLNNYMMEI